MVDRSNRGAEIAGDPRAAAGIGGGGRAPVPGLDRRRPVESIPHRAGRGAQSCPRRRSRPRGPGRRPYRQSREPHGRPRPCGLHQSRRCGSERRAAARPEGGVARLHRRHHRGAARWRKHRLRVRAAIPRRRPPLFRPGRGGRSGRGRRSPAQPGERPLGLSRCARHQEFGRRTASGVDRRNYDRELPRGSTGEPASSRQHRPDPQRKRDRRCGDSRRLRLGGPRPLEGRQCRTAFARRGGQRVCDLERRSHPPHWLFDRAPHAMAGGRRPADGGEFHSGRHQAQIERTVRALRHRHRIAHRFCRAASFARCASWSAMPRSWPREN